MSTELYEGKVGLTRYCGPACESGSRIRYQITCLGQRMMEGEDFVTVSQEEGVAIALMILKDALESRGLNVRIAECHPFEILNSIGGLLGKHPGFDPKAR
jgi:hypothetical protein